MGMLKKNNTLATSNSCNIERIENTIKVSGYFLAQHISILLSRIYKATEKAGYTELILDFSKCTRVANVAMLAISSQITSKRKLGIDIKLELPEKESVSKLFINASWAHLIDPRRYEPGKSNIFTTQIPATQYQSSSEQHHIVDKIMNVTLGAIPEMNRTDFSAFEWSINEITDNVLTHSESNVGGLVQLSINKKKNIIQYFVADAGLGIPETMRSGNYSSLNDIEALEYAIREGVTRDHNIGQGNGLFGSYQVSHQCKGNFKIKSGHASLYFTEKDGFHITKENVPYEGTLILGEVNFSNKGLLANALKFKGKSYTPAFDFIGDEYTFSDEGNLVFALSKESDSFGTRVAGTPVRNKLKNIINMKRNILVQVDLSDIPIMSSSFADEVFGKLFVDIGPLEFMNKIKLTNQNDLINDLINKAISQRMRSND